MLLVINNQMDAYDFYASLIGKEITNDVSFQARNYPLEDVPPKKRTKEVCEIAIKILICHPYTNTDDILSLIPENVRSEKICYDSIELSPFNFIYIPSEIINNKICKCALTSLVKYMNEQEEYFTNEIADLLEKITNSINDHSNP